MSESRREFLSHSVRAGAAMSMMGFPALASGHTELPGVAASVTRSPKPLNILILGGTSFLGPHQIAYAMSRGHSITTFTRGRTEPTIHRELFRDVEQLVGDREDNLEALRGRTWDAVIDNSGRKVEWTRDSARLLNDTVELYLYTSSTGVYYPYLGSDIGEDTELVLEVPEGTDGEQSGEYSYGVMKANSEIEARRIFGSDRSIIVRPTYIMGPADGSDRFTYWPVRLERGGEVLVPGRTDDPVQFIDVRDLTGWMIRLIEDHVTGTFNGAGPASVMGMYAFVHGAHAAFNSAATFVYVPDHEFLREQRLTYTVPWIMPTGNNAGSARINIRKAISNGLTYTPLADSVRDIIEWWHSEAVSEERRENMVSGRRSLMAREAEIIAAWKDR
ncbi:NAD-dependent epimerase/dehydratase family protein [Gemmatimonadota bacterium]